MVFYQKSKNNHSIRGIGIVTGYLTTQARGSFLLFNYATGVRT